MAGTQDPGTRIDRRRSRCPLTKLTVSLALGAVDASRAGNARTALASSSRNPAVIAAGVHRLGPRRRHQSARITAPTTQRAGGAEDMYRSVSLLSAIRRMRPAYRTKGG